MTSSEQHSQTHALTKQEKILLTQERAALDKVRFEYIKAFREANGKKILYTEKLENEYLEKNKNTPLGIRLAATKAEYEKAKKHFRDFLHKLYPTDPNRAEFLYVEQLSEELKLKKRLGVTLWAYSVFEVVKKETKESAITTFLMLTALTAAAAALVAFYVSRAAIIGGKKLAAAVLVGFGVGLTGRFSLKAFTDGRTTKRISNAAASGEVSEQELYAIAEDLRQKRNNNLVASAILGMVAGLSVRSGMFDAAGEWIQSSAESLKEQVVTFFESAWTDVRKMIVSLTPQMPQLGMGSPTGGAEVVGSSKIGLAASVAGADVTTAHPQGGVQELSYPHRDPFAHPDPEWLTHDPSYISLKHMSSILESALRALPKAEDLDFLLKTIENDPSIPKEVKWQLIEEGHKLYKRLLLLGQDGAGLQKRVDSLINELRLGHRVPSEELFDLQRRIEALAQPDRLRALPEYQQFLEHVKRVKGGSYVQSFLTIFSGGRGVETYSASLATQGDAAFQLAGNDVGHPGNGQGNFQQLSYEPRPGYTAAQFMNEPLYIEAFNAKEDALGHFTKFASFFDFERKLRIVLQHGFENLRGSALVSKLEADLARLEQLYQHMQHLADIVDRFQTDYADYLNDPQEYARVWRARGYTDPAVLQQWLRDMPQIINDLRSCNQQASQLEGIINGDIRALENVPGLKQQIDVTVVPYNQGGPRPENMSYQPGGEYTIASQDGGAQFQEMAYQDRPRLRGTFPLDRFPGPATPDQIDVLRNIVVDSFRKFIKAYADSLPQDIRNLAEALTDINDPHAHDVAAHIAGILENIDRKMAVYGQAIDEVLQNRAHHPADQVAKELQDIMDQMMNDPELAAYRQTLQTLHADGERTLYNFLHRPPVIDASYHGDGNEQGVQLVADRGITKPHFAYSDRIGKLENVSPQLRALFEQNGIENLSVGDIKGPDAVQIYQKLLNEQLFKLNLVKPGMIARLEQLQVIAEGDSRVTPGAVAALQFRLATDLGQAGKEIASSVDIFSSYKDLSLLEVGKLDELRNKAARTIFSAWTPIQELDKQIAALEEIAKNEGVQRVMPPKGDTLGV